MSFIFTNDNGDEIENIIQCQYCEFIQAERHFGDNSRCPMCQTTDNTTLVETQSRQTGMSNLQYRRMLTGLQQDCDGIGAGTISSIKEFFESGDDFLDACKDAYDNQAYDRLTPVSGIGETTAERLCLTVAEMEGWSGGNAEVSFKVA